MKFEDFQTAEDLVRQYNEVKNILDSWIGNGPDADVYLSISYFGTGTSMSLKGSDTISESVRDALIARLATITQQLATYDVVIEPDPVSPPVDPVSDPEGE